MKVVTAADAAAIERRVAEFEALDVRAPEPRPGWRARSAAGR
jgi:hypothetical protein